MVKKIRFIFLFVIICPAAFSQVSIQWASRYTGAGNNTDKAEAITVDAAGNVYVCGTTWSGTSFDYLTVKYNNAGTQLWSVTYNGAGNSIDEARAIAVDASGNVYVTGASYFAAGNDDYVTIKYNSSGVQQWLKNYNGPGNATDEAWAIALDASGNVFVTGGSIDAFTGEDYATIKYDPVTGNPLQVARYTFSGNNIDRAQSIYIDASNNVYITGFSYGSAANDLDYATLKYDNNLTALWASASRYNGVGSGIDQAKSVKVNAAGNVYVTGYSRNTYILDDDITTVMYNSAGIQQWVSRYGAGNNQLDRSYGLAVDAAGNCYVAGMVKNTTTNQDMVTVKYNISGAQQWAKEYNGPSNGWDEARSCVLEPTGTYVYVTGFSQSSTNQDATTIKYATSNGAQQWLTSYNYVANNVDQAYAISLDASQNVYVAGMSNGGSSTGNDALTIKYCQLNANATRDTAICLNASIQLTTNAPGAVSYTWTPASGLSSTTIANPVANPTITTTYVVIVTNASGCTDADTLTITVNPLPSQPITPSGPTTFCQGGQVNLCATTGTAYSWSPGGQTTQCINNVNQSGTYTVLVTNANSCAAQSSITVTVNPLPIADAGRDTAICLSKTVQLNATGGATYTWSPASTLSSSTGPNPVAGPVTTTTYTVVVVSSAGCTATDTVKVTIIPNPPVPTLTYNFDTLCSSAALSYQWYTLPNNPVTGQTGQCFIVTQNGTYWVVITNNQGCTTASAQYTVNNIGIGEVDNYFGSSVYPNPSSGHFMLEMNLNAGQNVRVKIMSLTGELIMTKDLGRLTGQVTEEFNMEDKAKGVYFLQMISEQGITTRRIIFN